MNEPLIRVRKWFFAWQDEKQESWLGDMSRKGLRLKGFGLFGSFLFEQGPARDYAYRLDYNQDKPSEDYQQLILDSGWEHVGERNGWHYWRKEVKSGQASEIFTDTESKWQKYQRLFTTYTVSMPAVVTMYIIGAAAFHRFPGRHPQWFVVTFVILFMGWIVFAIVNAIMIYLRMNELKKKQTL
jgi:hypothetical protein